MAPAPGLMAMRKIALVFVTAVILPSLVLAWLAARSIRDQQFLIERQQSIICQGLADRLAAEVQAQIEASRRAFTNRVERLAGDPGSPSPPSSFDERLRQDWPLAEVGFVVSLDGRILAPERSTRDEARNFLEFNERFLTGRELVQVYANKGLPPTQQPVLPAAQAPANRYDPTARAQQRSVLPQQSLQQLQIEEPSSQPGPQNANAPPQLQNVSALVPSTTEFRRLIGEDRSGMLARFVENRLFLLFWHRPAARPELAFGAQINLPELVRQVGDRLPGAVDPALHNDVCVALLDDNARPMALSRPGFQAVWKRPFVATEIGEVLPHWELAVYLADPAKLTQAARVTHLALGLVLAVLVAAIGVGSWLIIADLKRQVRLAAQKTDFVSNVSHELKTPLTSIRMFSELLAGGGVAEPDRQRLYLNIIAAETARLTRLINNVLDFARLQRGERKYCFERCDLADLVRETAATSRLHLERSGFHFDCDLPASPLWVAADRDALAQVILNLLSNAEKYSGDQKEITLRLADTGRGMAELRVLDRGLGVPPGCEEKIFEQFFRAHDNLNSGIPGSGLGLTLARELARAHGGEITYTPRPGGGSCFALRLPLAPAAASAAGAPAPLAKAAAL